MKKILFVFICVLSVVPKVWAAELAESAKSVILIEASTGEVLYERNADEALAPASMTKIMTLILTMEAIEKGNIGLEDMVTVSENAASMGGSQVFLEAGASYTLDEMIKAVCIASGNDASVVLAEAIGGSTAHFVEMMNKKAKDLGLTATNFVNVYGLDADGHLSSARDMAKMSRELIKHDLILKYSSIYEEYLKKKDGSSLWMVNTNKLVRFYQGVDGLKTGYTAKAGFCLAATGEWKGLRLISVVMGEPDQDTRSKDTVELLNYGKSIYKVNTVLESGTILGEVDVELGIKTKVPVTIGNSVKDLVKINSEEINYSHQLSLDKVTAPLKKGDKVGIVEIYANNEKITEEPLVMAEDVQKCTFWQVMKRIFKTIVTG